MSYHVMSLIKDDHRSSQIDVLSFAALWEGGGQKETEKKRKNTIFIPKQRENFQEYKAFQICYIV